MTPEEFIAHWQNSSLNERAGAQQHFSDLCDLLGVDKPRDPDSYCFERGAKKAGGGDGWADVWKRGHFGWENKKPGRDLAKAYKQLTDYAAHLEHPPLLVVSDRERIIIHTAFTGYPDEPREILLADLVHADTRQLLRWVFTNPEKLRPEKSSAAITAEVAHEFSAIAAAMRERGIDHQRVAHFLVQCLFTMFAEDEHLLPTNLFTNLLDRARHDPAKAQQRISELFKLMRKKNGTYGDYDIAWFNGGLFQTIDVPDLISADLTALHAAATRDWRAIDPTIFGTLFERGLDPAQRVPLGAHYTDPQTIQKLIDPLISEPLLTEWQQIKAKMTKRKPSGAAKLYQSFLLRLSQFRVLDPACGSGNFLYLSLAALRDLEKRAQVESMELGLPEQLSLATGPHNVLGIETNEFAAELARVTVWIGDIQWCRRNSYPHATNPILQPLDGIERRDAILAADGSEPAWPTADVIVGNPPFLGGSKKRGALGDATFTALERLYAGRVPAGADLVCYWFEKARAQIAQGKAKAAGLVATQAIRAGANRAVMTQVCASTSIFNAWSDEPWINAGAAVRVSLVCFGASLLPVTLNGQLVGKIYPDLTGSTDDGMDLTRARSLATNAIAFEGTKKYGDFDIPGETARQWLLAPNPNGRPSSDVVKPWRNGQDIAKRTSDTWIIDFGVDLPEADAALYEKPYEHVLRHVKPTRQSIRSGAAKTMWWIHERPRVNLRVALKGLDRYIVTPRVAKHRFFVWCDKSILPDSRLLVIARQDDATFGILSSRIHVTWALANASRHGVGNDPTYNAKSCFETFPFPADLTPADTKHGTATLESGAIVPQVAEDRRTVAAEIAEAAHRLNTLRENWLNPPEWVERVPEVVPGYPDRIIPKSEHEKELKKRTLTNLYNQRPAWLDHAHRALDATVAAAYGWDNYSPEMPDAEILSRLLALNGGRGV